MYHMNTTCEVSTWHTDAQLPPHTRLRATQMLQHAHTHTSITSSPSSSGITSLEMADLMAGRHQEAASPTPATAYTVLVLQKS